MTDSPVFPCAAYCTLGKRFYTVLSYLTVASSEKHRLAEYFRAKYHIEPSNRFKVVNASLEFPFRLFNFDGARLPDKPRTERVQLIDEFLIFIAAESDIVISKFPVTAYWTQRAEEMKSLFSRLVPDQSEISVNLIDSLLHATTSKNAKLGDVHYERLEFLGDATLTLLLSLCAPSMAVFNDRKSNCFLDRVARNFRLQEFVQDMAPTVNRRISLASRGLQHGDAKKVLADVVEAVLGAIMLHLDLNACFKAGKSIGLFDFVLADAALQDELAIAYGKFVGTLAVFRKFPNFSVGELHLERERIVGNRKGRDFAARTFSIGKDTLTGLDHDIRDKVDDVLYSFETGSPHKKRARSGMYPKMPETFAEALEAVRLAEVALKEARDEFDSRVSDLEDAQRILSKFRIEE